MDQATWDTLRAFKKRGNFDPPYPQDCFTYFAPDDDIHSVVRTVIGSASHVLYVAMFGWDDAELDALFRKKWEEKEVHVKIALDATQAAGLGEKPLLAKWPVDIYGNDLIIGRSRRHKISHMKNLVADEVVIGGSTNWSTSGESEQNNELVVYRQPSKAPEYIGKISMIFAEMQADPSSTRFSALLGLKTIVGGTHV